MVVKLALALLAVAVVAWLVIQMWVTAYGVVDFAWDVVEWNPEVLEEAASECRRAEREGGAAAERCDALLRGSKRKWERRDTVAAHTGNAHLKVLCQVRVRMASEDLRRRFLAWSDRQGRPLAARMTVDMAVVTFLREELGCR